MKAKGLSPDIVNIITLGCSKNLVDSEYLMKQLDAGKIQVLHNADGNKARTVIINTCGFINDAKEESIDTILQYVKAKKQGLIDRVYVMGCLSERYKEALDNEIPEVDKYFGVNNIKDIIETIGVDYKKELTGERILTTPGHFAYMKISEGCDRTCSFCAIPLIRGKHRSKSIEELLHEASGLGKQGVKELILIAQDLTYYGLDLYRKQMLPDLLKRLSDTGLFKWIRLHYAYPVNFPHEVIRVMKERENVCNYIDIPFQHISGPVLKKMRRNHNAGQVKDLIRYFRDEIPGITLRTTFLVGHPGEGEAEFDELLEFVRDTRFDRLGVFTYSEEENTYSSMHFRDLLPAKIKQARADRLMEIQREVSGELNKEKVGQTMNVVIDRLEGDFYTGRSEADSPEVDNEILIEAGGKKLVTGRWYKTKITSSDDYDLFGEVI